MLPTLAVLIPVNMYEQITIKQKMRNFHREFDYSADYKLMSFIICVETRIKAIRCIKFVV